MLLILLSVALLALSSAQDLVSESSSEESLSIVLDGTNSDSSSDKDFPQPPPDGPRGPPPGGPGEPPPSPPPNDGNGDEDHPHQRRNLSRVQMKSHHPSNLKVINRT
ncbi:hypothetical protein AB1E18_004290 [Capra hircus]